MRPRVLNMRTDAATENAVYVGRPSKWGNPFKIGPDGTRLEIVAAYEAYLRRRPDLVAALPELRGRNLACWCSPRPCHADVLLRLANDAEGRGGLNS